MNLTRTLILGCCIATAPFTAPLQAGIIQSVKEAIWGCQAPPPTIKVLIADNLQDIPVEVRGGYRLYDPHTQDYLSSRYFSKKQQFKAVNSGLKWGEEFPGIYQLQLIPDEDTVLLVNGRPYRGTLYIYAIEDTVSIVNEVPIEDYLESVLSSSNQQQSPETLAAIAITERTAAYYAVENPKSAYWATRALVELICLLLWKKPSLQRVTC
jgi:stage II sporulation protein D